MIIDTQDPRTEKPRSQPEASFKYANFTGTSCQQVTDLVKNERNHEAYD